MTLGELIAVLEKADQEYIAPLGFGEPHSYRGYYERLAFAPEKNVSVASMLAHAKSALGQTFMGYKGGEYTMHEDTICHIAKWGEWGDDEITPVLAAYLTGRAGVEEKE
jgi:hypothetical protein